METNWWCDDYYALKNTCMQDFAEKVDQVCKTADNICSNSFIFRGQWEMERTRKPVVFHDNIQWDFIPFGDEEWIFALNRHTCFLVLAQAWLFTGNEKYAQHFSRLLNNWIDHVLHTAESEKTTWRALEAGIRCENWLKTFLCFEKSGVFTPELKQKFDVSLKEHAEYLLHVKGAFSELSNWGVLETHGLFLLGVYFHKEEYIKAALSKLARQISRQVLRDGTQWEQSPMYHCEVLHCCIDTLLIARRNHISVPQSLEEQTHRMLYALARWCKPNGRLICQSDSDDFDARDILTQGAYLFADSEIRFFAYDKLDFESLWELGPQAQRDYEALQSCSPSQCSFALKDSGNYMLRGSLNQDSSFLHMHCGCIGSGHGHCDYLHVDVYSRGEDILVDSGRYTYVDNPIRLKLKMPAAHNVTRVDMQNFCTCSDSWGYTDLNRCVKGEFFFGEQVDFLSGAHLGYQSIGVYTERRVVYLKPDIFILCDVFYTKDNSEHVYERYFHFNPKGDASENNNTVFYDGENVQAYLVFPNSEQQLVFSNEPVSYEYNCLEHGKSLCVSGKANGTCGFITVIAIDDKGASKNISAKLIPVGRMDAGNIISDGEGQAVEINHNGKKFTVFFQYGEKSKVDLFTVGKYCGYGRTIVFSEQNPTGYVLQW